MRFTIESRNSGVKTRFVLMRTSLRCRLSLFSVSQNWGPHHIVKSRINGMTNFVRDLNAKGGKNRNVTESIWEAHRPVNTGLPPNVHEQAKTMAEAAISSAV